jgi:hemerythrin-like metal-binding protein
MHKDAFVHYMVGVQYIDNVHWALIERMRCVIQAFKRGDIPTACDDAMALAAALKEHHEDEEHFMESIGYPYLAAHKHSHVEQWKQMHALVTRACAGENILFVVETLERCFANHVDDQDMQYSHWIKANNIIVDRAA